MLNPDSKPLDSPSPRAGSDATTAPDDPGPGTLCCFNPVRHPICLTLPSRLTPGSSWHEHIPFAMCLVDMLRPEVLVELGTYRGDSYCAFCQAVKELGLPTRCYAIDTWTGDPHTGSYGPDVLAELRQYHDPLYGSFSTLVQSTFEDALRLFPDGSVTLLHIDGYHTYEAVKRDFEAWLPKMSETGVILLHDTQEVRDDFGVWRLWKEISSLYPSFEFLHGHGLGVLGVGKKLRDEVKAFLSLSGSERDQVRQYFARLGARIVDYGRLQERVDRLSNALVARQLDAAVLGNLVKQTANESASRWQDVFGAGRARLVDRGSESHSFQDATTSGFEPTPCGRREPLVSVIIPMHEHLDLTVACVAAIKRAGTQVPHEIIIVDDGSSEDTTRSLSNFAALLGIQVVFNRSNLGFSESCNRGAAVAKGKYLVFLNNDTEPLPGWLDALVKVAEQNPSVGAVGAKLLFPDGRLQEAGGIVFSDGSAWNYGRGGDPLHPQFNFLREVDYCSAACLLVRADLFRKLGGFDTRFAPAYYEDTDLCFAIRRAGFRVVYQPEAAVIHFEGATAGTDVRSGVKSHQVAHQRKFVEKWRDVLVQQYPPDARLVRRASNRAPGKRILVVDAFAPMYDRASGSRRLWEILNALVESGHAITFIARNGINQERYGTELQRLGVETYLTDPDAMKALGYNVPAPSIELDRLLRETQFDVAWIESYDVAEQYLPLIRRASPRTRIIVDSVDLHFLRERREAETLGKSELLSMATATMERELKVYSQADAVIVVSETELGYVRSLLPNQDVYVIPNVHRPTKYVPPFDGRRGLLFVGNFRHRPNVDAVAYFVHHILPLVRKRLPEASVTIVGDAPPPAVRELEGSGVTVTGWVPDLAPYLQRHRVLVAPLRFGAGLKGKIGEALANGLPVVTTSIGAEGMPGAVETGVLRVADDPESFAEAVACLYTDPEQWNEASRRGWEYVSEHYTPEIVRGKLEEIVASLAPDRPNPALFATPRVPSPPTSHGASLSVAERSLLSIVIPVYRDAEATEKCLQAVETWTRPPYEVLLVDNASDEDVKAVISRASGYIKRLRVIENVENLGYPVACNQGLAMAQGDFVVIMNSDVVVTPHWSERLIAALSADPQVGMVGPRTNYATGAQVVRGACYDETTLAAWSEQWHRLRAGSIRFAPRLVGFLLMLRRDLLEQVGGLDPLFGAGNFEDDDLSLRAMLAGYKLAIAEDVFVHHYGSRSFFQDPSYYATLLEVNRHLFAAKWGLRFSQDGRYDPTEVLRQAGHRRSDLYIPLSYDALFSPRIEPIDLELTANRRLLCVPDPSDREMAWLGCVMKYLSSFGPGDKAALIVRVEPTSPNWLSVIVDSIEREAKKLGIRLDERDDLVIEASTLPSADRGRVYRAADVFIPLPGVRREFLIREARACGLDVLGGFELDNLRPST